MTKKSLPTPEQLRELLSYDPETGLFLWRERPECMFKTQRGIAVWKARFVGRPAFTANLNGYRQGMVFGRTYYAHRVAWAIHYGEWPEDQIDHINCDRSDNRISNLRKASNTENARNKKLQRNNTSGLKGASWSSRRGKWAATICADRKQRKLGFFDTKEEAHEAYAKASLELHAEFARAN